MEEWIVAKTAFTLFLVLLAGAPGFRRRGAGAVPRTAAGLRDRLAPLWRERAGRYVTSSDRTATGVNAAVLAVDSIAARRGAGDPREAARARAIVRWLTGPAVWRGGRTPGWMAGPRGSSLLPVYQSEAVGGLVQARGPPGARAAAARRRRDPRAHPAGRAEPCVPLAGAALEPDQLVLEMIAARAVNGAPATTLAGQGVRRYLNRFLAGVRPTRAGGGNLGPGLRFHYLPYQRPGDRSTSTRPSTRTSS